MSVALTLYLPCKTFTNGAITRRWPRGRNLYFCVSYEFSPRIAGGRPITLRVPSPVSQGTFPLRDIINSKVPGVRRSRVYFVIAEQIRWVFSHGPNTRRRFDDHANNRRAVSEIQRRASYYIISGGRKLVLYKYICICDFFFIKKERFVTVGDPRWWPSREIFFDWELLPVRWLSFRP